MTTLPVMAVRLRVHLLAFADCSLIATNPVEPPVGEATEDMPAVAADSQSATGDELLPGGAMSVEEEHIADEAIGMPVSEEAPTSKVEEAEVDAAGAVAVDDGSVGVNTEPVAACAVGANEKPPASHDEVLGEAEAGAPGANIVAELSADGILPVVTEDFASALDADTELAPPLVVDQTGNSATELVSEPAIKSVLEPEHCPKHENEHEHEPSAKQAEEPRVVGLADLPVGMVVEKRLAETDDEALAVKTVKVLCYDSCIAGFP